MTVTLNLKPEIEAIIAQKADAEGTGLPDYIEKLLEEAVKPEPPIDHSDEQRKKNQEALAFIRQRMAEDKTDDSEELERRQVEWQEFEQALNDSHTSNRVLFS